MFEFYFSVIGITTIAVLILIYPTASAMDTDRVIVANLPQLADSSTTDNPSSEAAVIEEITTGKVELLDRFLKQGGNPNRFFHTAVNAGSIDAVKLMLDRGANVNLPDSDGLTPLMVAARHTYRVGIEMLQLLIDRGAKINARASKGSTPLMFACLCPAKHYEDIYVQAVKLLIKHGAKVNVKNQQNLTPLTIAKNGKWTKIVAVLKRSGARL